MMCCKVRDVQMLNKLYLPIEQKKQNDSREVGPRDIGRNVKHLEYGDAAQSGYEVIALKQLIKKNNSEQC